MKSAKQFFPILLILFYAFSGCKNSSKENVYDSIIIGGGLAGLKTAFDLKEKKIVLLEKESRLGGRIWTKNHSGINYEMGALFGYTEDLLPDPNSFEKLIREEKKIGFFIKNQLVIKDSMQNALLSVLEKDSEKETLLNIDSVSSIEEIIDKLPEDAAEVIKSSFNIIHPGNFQEYVSSRKMDSFLTFETNHYENGNVSLIDSYKNHLTGKYLLNSEVISVQKQGKYIIVKYLENEQLKELKTKSAVISVPAPAALKILTEKNYMSDNFLKSVKYGKGVAVIVVIPKENNPEFNYITTPKKSFNTVFQNITKDNRFSVYTVYFIEEFINKSNGLKNSDFLRIAIDELRTLNIGNFNDSNIAAKDVHFWNNLGTIISEKTYSQINLKALEPIPGVFLAGDYTFWNESQMPYGIEAAFQSGAVAAEKVHNFLRNKNEK